jgi:hypothetical protein
MDSRGPDLSSERWEALSAAYAESAQAFDRNHRDQEPRQMPTAAPDAAIAPARQAVNLAASGPMVSAILPQSGQVGDMVRIQGSGLGTPQGRVKTPVPFTVAPD